MLYDLDQHHPLDGWLGSTPSPKGLPFSLAVPPLPRFTLPLILDFQFAYLVGDLPEGFSFYGTESGKFGLALAIRGPADQQAVDTLKLRLQTHTGLEWYSLLLENSETGQHESYMSAHTGTSLLPVPVWVTELGRRTGQVGQSSKVIRIQVTDSHLSAHFRIGSDLDDSSPPIFFRGIPQARIVTRRSYYTVLPQTIATIQLNDWKTLVAKGLK